mmetsp:Transcript_4724/g.15768  ORF Transcript_4724/g.15768 Transcript_4724/m.15768 type:complete len:229 (-) Transcript_4724:255-941(-)
MAYTLWPTRRSDEVPMGSGRAFSLVARSAFGDGAASPEFPPNLPLGPVATGLSYSTWSTAMSLSSSYPTTVAEYTCWSWNVTLTFAAPATTCQFVTTCPNESHTIPDPAPCGASWMFSVNTSRRCARLVMYTTEGVFFWNKLIVACSSAVRYRVRGVAADEAGTGLAYVCVGASARAAGGAKSPTSTDARSAPAVSKAMGRDSWETRVSAPSVSSRRDARHSTRDVFP